MFPRVFLAAVAACLLSAASASAALVHGELAQLSGTSGCVNFPTPTDGCAAGTGAGGSANAIAASPDGKHVYATGQNNVLVFSRNSDGGLTQIQCLDDDGSSPDGGDCDDGTALGGAYSIEVSPDGSHVFVGGTEQVAVFSRDTSTGQLTYQSCASNSGMSSDTPPVSCENARGLFFAYDLALARDGRTLYVASNGNDGVVGWYPNDGVVMFDVASDGSLDQPDDITGCYTDTGAAIDPTVDADDPLPNQCTNVRAMNQASGVLVSPDGKHLYVQSASNEMGEYVIDQATGALTQIGCVNESGAAQGASGDAVTTCTPVRAAGDYYAAMSPDGKHLYAADGAQRTLGMFVRDAATGLLSQPDSPAVCLAESGDGVSCNDARELDSQWNLLVSPDGRNVYVADASTVGAIAVFERDAATGLLAQPSGLRGCVSDNGSGATCADGRFMEQVNAFASSPDGAFLYAIGINGPVNFSRGVPPICSDGTASTAFGAPVAITLNCSDANGDSITITPSSASHGTLGSVDGGKVTYTPAAGYSGGDAFTFSATDGANSSNTATTVVTTASQVPAGGGGGGGGTTPPPAAKPALPSFAGGTVSVDKKGRFRLKLTCPAGAAACSGKVLVRTASAVSSAKKKRVLVLARKGYNVAAGKTASIRLTMGKKARRYVKRKGKVKALAVFTGASGGGKKTVSLTLKQ